MTVAAFAVDTAWLVQTVEDLARVTTALDEALADADAASERMHAEWDGEAASAHAAAHARWAEDSRRMAAALVRMRGALDGAGGNYTAAGAVNVRMWA